MLHTVAKTCLNISRWALKNITTLRNVNRLKAYIQSVSGTLHKFTHFGLIVPTCLAQKIRLQRINIDLWRSNGIPDEGVYLIVEYYAFEAGRYCTQKATQAIAHFTQHRTFDGFVYSAFSPEKSSPEKRVQASLLRRIGKIVHPVIEVNTPAGKIDILTDHEIIEVKNVLGWKSAVGQLLIYSHYYPNHQKIIHLFGKCCPNTKKLIKFHCDEFHIQVTWQ